MPDDPILLAPFGGLSRPADGVTTLAAGDLDALLKRRAEQVQSAVIKQAIRILRVEDQKAGRQLPRDVLTYIRYANERFLAGLTAALGGTGFAVKGGNAIAALRANRRDFPARFDSPRETRDLDLRVERPLREEEVRALFDRVVGTPEFRMLTGLAFGEPRVFVTEARDGLLPGAQIECSVFLGPPLADRGKGTPFKLEITYGPLAAGSWAVSPYPTLADLTPGRPAWHDLAAFAVPHAVPEMMFADKVHAIVRHGLGNTRLKDLFDLHCLAAQYTLDGVLVHDCVLHVFHEYGQDHLLPGGPRDIPGLDPERFATPANRTAWRAAWRDWTGVAFDEPLPPDAVPPVDLPEALRSVAEAVTRLGVFGPGTAARAAEAGLLRVPVPQLLTAARAAAGTATPQAVADLRGAVEPEALRAQAFGPAPAGAAALVRAEATAAAVADRVEALAARHADVMAGTGEDAAASLVGDAARALASAIRAAAAAGTPESAAAAAVLATAEALPDGFGEAHPLRALVAARATVHLQGLPDLTQGVQRAAEMLAAIADVGALEQAAGAARAALALAHRRDTIEETRALIRAALGFADAAATERLEAAHTALGNVAKAVASNERALARCTAVSADVANHSVGRDASAAALAQKARATLPREAGWLASECARARAALAALVPRPPRPALAPPRGPR